MERVHKRSAAVYNASMRILFSLLGLAGLAYLAAVLWVYASQGRLLFYPRTELEGTPDLMGLAYEDVRLSNALGTHLHGWWVPHETARFTVLFSHGNGGNVSHRLETLRLFHSLGLSTLLYDYSGYGQSGGEPSETAMRADARAVWDWLTQERGVAPERIILFGRSLGGAVTARLASELAAEGVSPAGMVLESTFTSVADMGARLYPWLPVRLLVKYRYDSAKALSGLQVPALFAHAEEDEIVPYALGRELYEGYDGPKDFFLLRGGHNDGYLFMGPDYPEGLDRFLAGLEK
ncbi:alpha/beta fold hydrolase [Pseudodesulfovibrio cashew]|uniref:Alpha/beta fold hydrolase n=1 Tax=Pseudodesulfovibrio cashew TaxID=2678688 RepID=A0A6I6JHL1_9BACT|nr:alpha/beta hydrolase [Pseudodesulfovibrio cashew]QGY39842.1 alpha/beta fold hydrolase [Pseudodesulfovibrio cashew]